MITLMCLFDESTKAADAIDELQSLGVSEDVIEVMTGIPYPEQSLGYHREWLKLPYIVLVGAIVGLLIGIFLSLITPSFYPLTIGGRSTAFGPPAAIITFVFTMMATIVSTFLGVLWEMDFPSFENKHYDKHVTSGHIAIYLKCQETREDEISKVMEAHGGNHIQRSKKVEI